MVIPDRPSIPDVQSIPRWFHLNTPLSHAFARAFLEGDDGYRIGELEDPRYEAIETQRPRAQPAVSSRWLISPRGLAARLHKWIEGGRYAALFDNAATPSRLSIQV